VSEHHRQGSDHTRGDHRAIVQVALAHALRRDLDTLAAMVEPIRSLRQSRPDRLVQRQAGPVPRLGR